MIRKTLLAAAIAGFALHAQAALVTVNFGTDGFDGGSLFGQVLSGQLTYDDTTLTSTTDWLPLGSLSFTVAGQTYTLSGTDLDWSAAVFTDGLFTGVDAVTYDAGGRDYAFVSGFGSPYIFFSGSTDQGDFGFANFKIPEPASYALVLGALGGALFARRRKA
jgi:hypothetical protein